MPYPSMATPLQHLRNLDLITAPQCAAGQWYATILERFRATNSRDDRAMLEALRAIVWTTAESGHSFRLIVGIAGNNERWRCVQDATTNDHPRTKRQLDLLRVGLQRLAEYKVQQQELNKAA